MTTEEEPVSALALRERYVNALITRLLARAAETPTDVLCDRIERNIVEHARREDLEWIEELFDIVERLLLKVGGAVADPAHIVSSDSGPEPRREFDPERADWTPAPASLSDSEPIGPSLDSPPGSSPHPVPICGRPCLVRTIELGDGTAEALMGTCWMAPGHDGHCSDTHEVYVESPDEHAEHADSIAADPEPDSDGLITLADPVIVAPEPEPAQPLLAQMSEAEKARGRQELMAKLAAERADAAEREPRVERVSNARQIGDKSVVSARPTVPIRPLSSPKEICRPGCGESFTAGAAFASHRRNCRHYQAFRAEHTTTIPATFETHPPAETPDPIAARDAFEATRRANAGAAAERTRQALRGEDPPAVAPVAPVATRPFTANQERYLQAVRAANGSVADAARALQLSRSATGRIYAEISSLRGQGRLPADVDELIAARKAKRA